MAVDPKKLKMFAADLAEGDLDEDDLQDDELDEEEESDEVPETPPEPKLDHDSYVKLLSKYGSDIQNSVDELDRDQLRDPSKPMASTDQLILMQGFHDLEDELNMAMRDYGPVKPSEAQEIASELFDDQSIEDPYTFAGWLVRASKIAANWQSADEKVGAKMPDQDVDDDEMPDDEDVDEY